MITLVTTVLNDQAGCAAFFEQMEAQTYLPNEIVIVDGGSKDGTWEFLQNYQPTRPYSLRVFQEIGCNVACGRNLAIAQAKHEIIVSTDIGCTWEQQWLEELAQPLLKDHNLEAVMGSWQVRWEDLKSNWAKAEYIRLNGMKFLAVPTSHASSRSIAYKKSLWEKIGGYPEDLTLAGDDMVFALLLHRTTNNVAAASSPRCYWERPEKLKSFCKEARRNFRGGGEAGIWVNYGLLVGGRLLLEPLLILISLFCLFAGYPIWITALFLLWLLLSIGQRFLRVASAIQSFQGFKDIHLWGYLFVFEYLIKFWSVLGYWEGFLSGFNQCRECRDKLGTIKLKHFSLGIN